MKDFEDELDFKPLSEGLGFHQKQVKLEAGHLDFVQSQQSPASIKPIYKTGEKEKIPNEILPIWSQSATKTQNSWGGNVDLGLTPQEDGIIDRDSISRPLIIDNPFYVPRPSVSPVEVVTLKFSGHDGLRKMKTKPVTTSFMAILMDVFTLISLCMIFLTFYFASQDQSLSEVIIAIPHNPVLKNQFMGLTISIGFLYLIFSRCVFGRTIGEWMFHMQLGSTKDQEKSIYPIKVFIRTLFVFLTGLIFFPIVSYLFKKDYLVYMSGLELHMENQ